MVQSRAVLRQSLPWMVSSASGLYILRRIHRVSVADPVEMTLRQFFVQQGDVIICILSGPASWYIVNRAASMSPQQCAMLVATMQVTFHQLREVFTALTLGVGVLSRRLVRSNNNPELLTAVERMDRVVRSGRAALLTLEQASTHYLQLNDPQRNGRQPGTDRLS